MIALVFRIGSLAGMALVMAMLASPAEAEAPRWKPLDQGANWTAAARKDFYSRDQGSRLMPLRWIAALKQPNGEPFMVESLSRYGYLPNEESNPPGLPVGFTVDGGSGGGTLGITCSACHTRQIEVGGEFYRVDGGPAIVDFQSFLADLDTAVNTVLTDPKAFAGFAHAVLGSSPSQDQEAKLRDEVQTWYMPYHALMARALPKEPWGVARLDAVGMIFNRLAGLDIGPPPSHMIPENIQPADAPVRYPFLWNAAIQDRTQWPGFTRNGDNVLALARNLGEVYGVFGVFHPIKDEKSPLGFDYLSNNSANFPGLRALEDLLWKIGPPQWPWAVDSALAATGKAIFESKTKTEQGGCAECHAIKTGCPRPRNQETWHTPIQDVGSDSREYDVLKRLVKTGVLEGARIPEDGGTLSQPLKSTEEAVKVLGTAVKGALLSLQFGPQAAALKGVYKVPAADGVRPEAEVCPDPPIVFSAYESRVLEGIWATAPYLHNGSVPSLAELLKPAAERIGEFKIGPAYDPTAIGLAAEQTQFNYTLKTTDCSNRNSGNSRCGHEFGIRLSPDEKKALLEYLKTL
jgi:hypothetical protein